jgi:hypothetical protein
MGEEMNGGGPWRLFRLHIATGQRTDRLVKSGEQDMHGHPIIGEMDILRFVNQCNAAQPGTWQYWI